MFLAMFIEMTAPTHLPRSSLTDLRPLCRVPGFPPCQEYVPTSVDVGHCLRVEVLAYLDGNFHCMVCDISTPVEPGAPVNPPRFQVHVRTSPCT